jgi:hypothetical protein
MSSTRKSICIDCILFTLKDKSVKENKYISIFLMWLSTLSTHAELDEHDMLSLKVDEPTFNYLNTHTVFVSLFKKSNFKKKVIVCPIPTNLYEGMLMKYLNVNYTQDVYMYCDIDVLIAKPLTSFINNFKLNTLYLQPEGPLSNSNYGAAFSKEELASFSKTAHGFSAGKYFIYGKEIYANFIKSICKLLLDNSTIYYTLDQPFFNKAAYVLDKKYNIDIHLLNSSTISVNLGKYSKDTTIFIDSMGIPGDEEFHFDKVLNVYIMIQADSLQYIF